MHKLEIRGLTKRYDVERERRRVVALSDVFLTVADGEFMAIVGPSGCGKTTLLNIVAGLMRHDGGDVIIDGRTVTAPGVDRAVVFQQASLLPWRTVAGNVRYGMELQKRVDASVMRSRTEHFITLVGLSGFERHFPSELSGGMQQRVNLARALAADPVVLLMDEPFAALDAQNRVILQAELVRLWEQTGKTVIYVTHSIEEALLMGDRTVIMTAQPGRIKKIIDVPFPHPRDLIQLSASPEFGALKLDIWRVLEEEVTRARAEIEQ